MFKNKYKVGDILQSKYTGCFWKLQKGNVIECVGLGDNNNCWSIGDTTILAQEKDYYNLIGSEHFDFKFGDKVKNVESSSRNYGKIATIIGFHSHGEKMYYRYEDGTIGGIWANETLDIKKICNDCSCDGCECGCHK